jgi:hypothetical protein
LFEINFAKVFLRKATIHEIFYANVSKNANFYGISPMKSQHRDYPSTAQGGARASRCKAHNALFLLTKHSKTYQSLVNESPQCETQVRDEISRNCKNDKKLMISKAIC